jgi:hypothetical protein
MPILSEFLKGKAIHFCGAGSKSLPGRRIERKELGKTNGSDGFPSSFLPWGQDALHATQGETHKKSPKIRILLLKFEIWTNRR